MPDSKPTEMTHDRALEIVRAINMRAWLAMGVADHLDGCRPLVDVSLAQMIEAAAIVRSGNDRRAAGGASYGINVVPADRLIAAVYVVENYRPAGEAIAATTIDGRDQLVAVLYANAGTEGAAS